MVRTGDDSRQLPIAEVKPDSWSVGSPEKTHKDDTVTLTKTQFQQILEAIGQTSVINGKEKEFNSHENATFSPSKKISGISSYNPEVIHQEENNGNLLASCDDSCPQLHVPCPLDVVVSCPASLSWSSDPQTELSPSKLSPLSKVEQKRLQWEKEKAEMIDWNPWGKPGAGAPTKKTQVVVPITPRANNQLLMVQTSGAMPFSSSVPSGIPSCLPSPNFRVLPNALDHTTFLPNKNFTNYSCVAQPVKPVPPVFKSSSFNFY